ncbi:MAG: hypothetical protein KIS94_12495, partial [Chitinophagales bacterium]|nr:hypothetical protein [Chitinophagales bacterium]
MMKLFTRKNSKTSKEFLLLTTLLMGWWASLYGQTNIALTATASHTGGGTVVPYTAASYNDNNIDACPGSVWGWVTTGQNIDLIWGSNQTFDKVRFFKGDRPFTSLVVQYWNGSSYVNIGTFSNGTACTSVTGGYHEYTFTAVTSTRIRFANVQGSNPNFREIQVFQACTLACCYTPVQPETTSPGSASTLNHIAASGCSNGTFKLGAGAYFDLPVTANTYYNFTWANGGANMSGFCATPQNGNATVFNSNQTGWFSGTTTSLRVAAIRSSSTWVATSATMTYRHTQPTGGSVTINGSTSPAAICVGGAIDLNSSGWSYVGATAPIYAWTGPNSYTNSNLDPASFNTTTTAQSGTYTITVNNNGCTNTANRAISVVADPSLSAPTANTNICPGGNVSLTSNLTNGTGTMSPVWQYSSNGTTYSNITSNGTPTGASYASSWTAATLTANGITAPGVHYFRRNLPATAEGCNATSAVGTITVRPVEVTATAGVTGPTYYANLATAFTAISNGTHQGAITVKVNCSLTSHPAATLGASGTGGANYTSVNVYPTANVSITGNTNGPLINLDGADNVTIDGRLNGSGATRNLTLINQATGTSASVIQLANEATQNTIRDLLIRGAGAGTARGMIFFTTSTAATAVGNSNNTVTNNHFTGVDASNRPYMCIYSLGTAAKMNVNNSVTNNHFYDFYRPSSTTYGVYAHTNSSAWTITGNHFYETTNIASNGNASYINIRVLDATNGTGHVISNNFIGGKASSAGGAQMNIASTTNQPIFYGILASSSNGTATPSSMQGNTIANISMNTRHNSAFRGIQIDGGTWNVGTTTGNTIGAASGTGSIVLTSPLDLTTQVAATATATVSGGVVDGLVLGTNTAIYTSAPTVTFSGGGGTGATATATLASNGTIQSLNLTAGGSGYTSAPTVTISNPAFVSSSYGILLNSTGTLDVRNNRVASITTVGNTNWSHDFYGIYRNTGVGVSTNIQGNLIGSATANSIHCSSATSNARGQSLWGIRVNTASPCTISDNTVENLTNAYTGTGSSTVSKTAGISMQDNRATDITITGNTIRNISTASAGTGTTTNSILFGIIFANTSNGTHTISGNTIHNLNASNGTAAVNVVGLYFGAVAAGAHTISGNFIHNLTSPSSNGSAAIFGIRMNTGSATISNNIINLGSASEQPTAKTIYGIYETGAAGNNYNIYYNTVRIGGTVTSGTGNTHAFYSAATTNIRNFRNNMFVNARSNSGGSGSHYAAFFNYAANTNLTLDYNNYFVSGTGGVLGRYNSLDVSALPIVTGLDANSYNLNPNFSTAVPTNVATHHRPTCGLAAQTGTGITVDYANTARNGTLPAVGAYEPVNAIPAAPTPVTATPSTICNGTSSNLNATSAGNTIRWYTVEKGGTHFATSASGVNSSVSPTSTTTYYAEALTGAGCVSSTRTAVTVTVTPTNTITLTSANNTQTRCSGVAIANITYNTTGATGVSVT